MTILERVLAKMKTSYVKYGFKKEELIDLAKLISKNLKDESTDEDIDTTLTANEGFAQMMQSVYNRGVSETNTKYKDYIPKPKEDPKPTPTPTPPAPKPNEPSFTLDDVKKLVSDGIEEGLKPYKEREERNRLQTLLQGNEKLKSVPKVFRERYHLEKEEDADKVADQIVSDYTALTQEQVRGGKFVEAPKEGGGAGSRDEDFRKMMEQSANRVKAAQDERAGHVPPTEPIK